MTVIQHLHHAEQMEAHREQFWQDIKPTVVDMKRRCSQKQIFQFIDAMWKLRLKHHGIQLPK
jgi:hypothetical protein